MTLRLLPLALALLAGTASADLLKDPQWQAWLEAGKTADLVRAAKAKGDDDQAAIALAMAAVDDNDATRLEASLPALQACTEKRPQAACSYALGRVYGQQAMTASVFKMPGLATKTKEQFAKAVELDPQLFEARMGLTQFYLMAPGFAGGSTAKAKDLAADVQARQPEQAKLLRFLVAAQGDDYASAEKELASVKPGEDRALQRELRNGWMRLGPSSSTRNPSPRPRASSRPCSATTRTTPQASTALPASRWRPISPTRRCACWSAPAHWKAPSATRWTSAWARP